MQSLTRNEARIVDFLIRNFMEKNSINEIGRRLKISPRGAYMILKKLERLKAAIPEKIGNAIYYKINLDEEIGAKLSEYVLVQNELNAYSQLLAEDLMPLRKIALGCVLFGSVLTRGREVNDIDLLIMLEKKDFGKIKNALDEIKALKPKKLHEVMQTREDLLNNIRKKDEVILEIMKKGRVLWGAEVIVEAIRNGAG